MSVDIRLERWTNAIAICARSGELE